MLLCSRRFRRNLPTRVFAFVFAQYLWGESKRENSRQISLVPLSLAQALWLIRSDLRIKLNIAVASFLLWSPTILTVVSRYIKYVVMGKVISLEMPIKWEKKLCPFFVRRVNNVYYSSRQPKFLLSSTCFFIYNKLAVQQLIKARILVGMLFLITATYT